MKKYVRWFRSLSFQHKIFSVCIISGIIPVIILGMFSFSKLRGILMQRENEVLQETMRQAQDSLDYKIRSYYDLMNYIIWDSGLSKAFSKNYDSNYSMYLAYKATIDPVVSTVPLLNPDIKGVRIYTDVNLYSRSKYLFPLSKIGDGMDVHAVTPHLVISLQEKTVQAYCKIPIRNAPFTTVVVLDLNYEAAFDSLSFLYGEPYDFLIADGNGRIVYTYLNQDMPELSMTDVVNKVKENKLRGYSYKTAELQGGEFSAVLLQSDKATGKAIGFTTNMILVFLVFCILFLMITTDRLSKILVRPLVGLANNMKNVTDEEDFSITVTYRSPDEIGQLISRFQSMIEKIRYMIEEVYQSKIKQQEYEYKALQSQINRHFLYNSLSLINSKAIMVGEQNISSMAQYLSSFYRTALNRGKNTIPVKDEWENICSYIQIQLLMHHHSFDAICDLDDAIQDLIIPNFILQPIVENAISHGLDYKEPAGRGILRVTGKADGVCIVFTVSDNGQGMDRETLNTVLTTKTDGYGIYNVSQRIQLYYGGGNCAFRLASEKGKGTTVTITLPKEKEQS
jgi:two-component system sensor histidine kinase YesM